MAEDESKHQALARYLEQHNLKHTRQRALILDAFLEMGTHVTSEEVYQRARGQNQVRKLPVQEWC